MTAVHNYNLTLTVNSTTVFTTTVPASDTTVDIFVAFPAVSRAVFTNYTLSVAAINLVGPSSFTSPVSIGEKFCGYVCTGKLYICMYNLLHVHKCIQYCNHIIYVHYMKVQF